MAMSVGKSRARDLISKIPWRCINLNFLGADLDIAWGNLGLFYLRPLQERIWERYLGDFVKKNTKLFFSIPTLSCILYTLSKFI